MTYEFEMPFEANDRIFYYFSDKPFDQSQNVEDYSQLNLNNDVFSLNTDKKIVKKWRLEIEIKKNGIIKPIFVFKEKGKGANKHGIRIEVTEFPFHNFNLKEGSSFIGVDFGSSNSYVVKVLKSVIPIEATEYPEYKVKQTTLEKLRETEHEFNMFKEKNLLSIEKVIEFSKEQMLQLVFHSNKIEGSPLTKGETEKIISSDKANGLNKNQLEAFNLEKAYKWVLENYSGYRTEPQNFIRMINKMILDGIEKDGGKYRTKPVKLSGMDYTPPISASVPIFMDKFSEELKKEPKNRSVIEYATTIHTRLAAIHPFVDGNGRSARLLMNAVLIDNGIPPIIVNFADKQRYFSALSDSNKGDLSSLIDFFLECYEESFSLYKNRFSADDKDNKEGTTPEDKQQFSIDVKSSDPIQDALHLVGGIEGIDPIAEAMKSKIEDVRKKREASYDLWAKGFEKFKSEFNLIVNEFNSNASYRNSGFSMRLIEYDMLSFEKYTDICSGNRATKTWYFAIEIFFPNGSERFLFFFRHCPRQENGLVELSPVSLVLARYTNDGYVVLKNEPIDLREIGINDANLVCFNRTGLLKGKSNNLIYKEFIADVIKAYL